MFNRGSFNRRKVLRRILAFKTMGRQFCSTRRRFQQTRPRGQCFARRCTERLHFSSTSRWKDTSKKLCHKHLSLIHNSKRSCVVIGQSLQDYMMKCTSLSCSKFICLSSVTQPALRDFFKISTPFALCQETCVSSCRSFKTVTI